MSNLLKSCPMLWRACVRRAVVLARNYGSDTTPGFQSLSSMEGNVVDQLKIKRALISVFDKTGVVELAKYLSLQGVELLSTGGTAQAIAKAGVPVTEVSDFTGFPEILGGRVKSLHPKIHGKLWQRAII